MDKIVIKNVLTTKERIKLLEDVKPLLLSGAELAAFFGVSPENTRFPGWQTHSILQDHPVLQNTFLPLIKEKLELNNLTIHKAWANKIKGYKKDIAWHSHKYPLACVYYLKTIPFLNSGTLFMTEFVKAPQNSLLIFPGYLKHTAPTYPIPIERYTISMDIIKGD